MAVRVGSVNLKHHYIDFFIMQVFYYLKYTIEYRSKIWKINQKYGHESILNLNQQVSQNMAPKVV